MCLTPISLLSLSNNYLTAKTLSLLLQYLSPRTCFRRVKLQSQQPSSDHVQPVHIYDVISIITCMPKYPAVHWGKKRKERLMSEIRSIGTITKKKKITFCPHYCWEQLLCAAPNNTGHESSNSTGNQKSLSCVILGVSNQINRKLFFFFSCNLVIHWDIILLAFLFSLNFPIISRLLSFHDMSNIFWPPFLL